MTLECGKSHANDPGDHPPERQVSGLQSSRESHLIWEHSFDCSPFSWGVEGHLSLLGLNHVKGLHILQLELTKATCSP